MQTLVDIKTMLVSQTLAPVSANASNAGTTAVDLQTCGRHTNVVVNNGVVTGSAIWTVQMQYSNDNSTWTNEPDAGALSGQITAAGVTKLSYTRTGRYARAVTTLVSGTSSIIGITIIAQPVFEPGGAGFDLSPTSVT